MRLALLLAVSLVAPFTACGGSQPSAATPAASASASSTATEPGGGLAPEDEVPAQPPSSPKDHCASPPCL